MKEIKLEFSVGDSVYTIFENKLTKQTISSVTCNLNQYGSILVVYKANNDMITLTNAFKDIDSVVEEMIKQYERIKEWEDKYDK